MEINKNRKRISRPIPKSDLETSGSVTYPFRLLDHDWYKMDLDLEFMFCFDKVHELFPELDKSVHREVQFRFTRVQEFEENDGPPGSKLYLVLFPLKPEFEEGDGFISLYRGRMSYRSLMSTATPHLFARITNHTYFYLEDLMQDLNCHVLKVELFVTKSVTVTETQLTKLELA